PTPAARPAGRPAAGTASSKGACGAPSRRGPQYAAARLHQPQPPTISTQLQVTRVPSGNLKVLVLVLRRKISPSRVSSTGFHIGSNRVGSYTSVSWRCSQGAGSRGACTQEGTVGSPSSTPGGSASRPSLV